MLCQVRHIHSGNVNAGMYNLYEYDMVALQFHEIDIARKMNIWFQYTCYSCCFHKHVSPRLLLCMLYRNVRK